MLRYHMHRHIHRRFTSTLQVENDRILLCNVLQIYWRILILLFYTSQASFNDLRLVQNHISRHIQPPYM